MGKVTQTKGHDKVFARRISAAVRNDNHWVDRLLSKQLLHLDFECIGNLKQAAQRRVSIAIDDLVNHLARDTQTTPQFRITYSEFEHHLSQNEPRIYNLTLLFHLLLFPSLFFCRPGFTWPGLRSFTLYVASPLQRYTKAVKCLVQMIGKVNKIPSKGYDGLPP